MAQTDKSLPTLAGELWEMVVAYARQETLDPLKRLKRFLKLGVPGAFLTGMGLIMLALAGLRALQTETAGTFDGNLTWVPYGIVLVGCVLVAVLSFRAIGAAKRRARNKGRVG